MTSGLRRDTIIANIGELSVTPRVIRRLSALLHDPNIDLTPAIAVLRTEPVLTAAIMAAANTPTHFRGTTLFSLETAVHRLGLRETYRVALLVTFRQGLRLVNLPDNRAADFLWARAIVAGCAMEELVSPADAPAGFCIGLLHLIGCLVMARAGAGLANFDNTSNARLAMAQEVSLGIAYPEVGALALQKWEFPPEVHEPIRYQMHPERAGAFVGTAVHLGRAVELAMFIEESRPGSPTYREGAKINAPLGPLARVVEARSTELMESFYTVPPRRPAWATDP